MIELPAAARYAVHGLLSPGADPAWREWLRMDLLAESELDVDDGFMEDEMEQTIQRILNLLK